MRSIKTLLLIQSAILLLLLDSTETFLNFEIGWISSFLVLMGSMYSYKRLVDKRVESFEGAMDRDVIEKIDDPYDLYSEDIPDDTERDIKEVIREEKARLKANRTNGLKTGAPAMVSLYRMVPYVLLVFGFIALQNNALLSLTPYLLGLGAGIFSAFITGKKIFSR